MLTLFILLLNNIYKNLPPLAKFELLEKETT